MRGPHNAITDVDGVLVGHHQRLADGWATGTTVVLTPAGATGAVDARGGAPGTRETDLLAPPNLVQQAHGVCLSGGSAYGLAAADGVMRWLSERGHGFPVGAQPHEVVPIVPAAVIFDLPRSTWGNRPDAEFGYAACEAAVGGPVAQGCVGAGTGAKVGSLSGGVGTASQTAGEGFTVGALAVVNARGEAVDFGTGRPWAADHEVDGEFGRALGLEAAGWPDSMSHRARETHSMGHRVRPGEVDPPRGEDAALNTTIGVVATDAALSKAECQRLAMAAQDGLARAVRPAHSMFDGDTVFALATGTRELPSAPGPLGAPMRAAVLDELCTAAAAAFARAIVHGLLSATALPGLPAYREWIG